MNWAEGMAFYVLALEIGQGLPDVGVSESGILIKALLGRNGYDI